MQRVDPDGALKMYMQSGEWDKCLQLAKELVMHDACHVPHGFLQEGNTV